MLITYVTMTVYAKQPCFFFVNKFHGYRSLSWNFLKMLEDSGGKERTVWVGILISKD